MICWNCRKEIPFTAKFCPHCEARAEAEPTAEEQAAIQDVLASMGPDVMSELRDAFEMSTTCEEFINRMLVGDCPKCGGSNTEDCENDPEIGAAYVGRCLKCGHFFFVVCGETLDAERPVDHDCPDFEDMEFDDEAWGDLDQR